MTDHRRCGLCDNAATKQGATPFGWTLRCDACATDPEVHHWHPVPLWTKMPSMTDHTHYLPVDGCAECDKAWVTIPYGPERRSPTPDDFPARAEAAGWVWMDKGWVRPCKDCLAPLPKWSKSITTRCDPCLRAHLESQTSVIAKDAGFHLAPIQWDDSATMIGKVGEAPPQDYAWVTIEKPPTHCDRCGQEFGCVLRAADAFPHYARQTVCVDCATRPTFVTSPATDPPPLPDPFQARGWIGRTGV